MSHAATAPIDQRDSSLAQRDGKARAYWDHRVKRARTGVGRGVAVRCGDRLAALERDDGGPISAERVTHVLGEQPRLAREASVAGAPRVRE